MRTTLKSRFGYVRCLMMLPLLTVILCLFAFTFKKQSDAGDKPITESEFKLVIDAGHGGADKGAYGNNLYEKDITLKIAKKIKELSPDFAIHVVLTRNDDIFLNPAQKSDFLNAQNADALY